MLFTLQPGLGHLHPMIPLARALRAAGHGVAFAASAAMQPRITAAGFDAMPAGPDWLMSDINRLFPELVNVQPPFKAPVYVSAVLFTEMLPEISAAIENFGPDVVVSEPNEFAGLAAAELAGLPYATHALGAARQLDALQAQAGDTFPQLRALEGLPPDPEYSWVYRYLYLDVCPRSLSIEDTPRPVAHPLRLVPFDNAGDEVLPEWVLTLPDRPLVYCTLGSIFNKEQGIFERMIEGLAGADWNVIVTVGSDRDPTDLGALPDNVHAARYIPQTLLFPRVAVAVTHGGFNTMMTAFQHDIPIIIMPFGSDHPINAHRTRIMGLGRVLHAHEFTARKMQDAVRELIEDVSYRTRVAAVHTEIDAMPGPELAVLVLERLVEERRPFSEWRSDFYAGAGLHLETWQPA